MPPARFSVSAAWKFLRQSSLGAARCGSGGGAAYPIRTVLPSAGVTAARLDLGRGRENLPTGEGIRGSIGDGGSRDGQRIGHVGGRHRQRDYQIGPDRTGQRPAVGRSGLTKGHFAPVMAPEPTTLFEFL